MALAVGLLGRMEKHLKDNQFLLLFEPEVVPFLLRFYDDHPAQRKQLMEDAVKVMHISSANDHWRLKILLLTNWHPPNRCLHHNPRSHREVRFLHIWSNSDPHRVAFRCLCPPWSFLFWIMIVYTLEMIDAFVTSWVTRYKMKTSFVNLTWL